MPQVVTGKNDQGHILGQYSDTACAEGGELKGDQRHFPGISSGLIEHCKYATHGSMSRHKCSRVCYRVLKLAYGACMGEPEVHIGPALLLHAEPALSL